MIFHSISEIPYRKETAVIINVGTKLVTTLALLSAIKRANMPVLLVDCPYENSLEDYNYFQTIMDNYKFDLIQLPLKHHGETLDNIFRNLSTDYILLIDSDLEILDNHIVFQMRKFVENNNVFGAGFRHGGFDIKKEIDYEEIRDGYYEERMWIPFTLLKTEMIKEALNVGFSFNIRTFYNIIPSNQKISRKLLYSKQIQKIAFLKNSDYLFFNFLKKEYHHKKPLVVIYDTGSDIYMHLRYGKKCFYVGIDSETGLEDEFVHHYNGITRKLMYDDPYNTGSVNAEYQSIINKLNKEYHFVYDNFIKKNIN